MGSERRQDQQEGGQLEGDANTSGRDDVNVNHVTIAVCLGGVINGVFVWVISWNPPDNPES